MQPISILACGKERFFFRGVGFCFSWFLHSDHCAIIKVVRAGRGGQLRQYRHKRQKNPLSLPPGPKDVETMAFDALAAECVKPKPKRTPGKDWISQGTWGLIAKWASLLRSCHIWQDARRRMKCKIGTAIKADKHKLTTNVGDSIVAELAKGDVKEAFRHLKAWYRKAAEMQARPCCQTMEHQTNKREELYAEWAAYGKGFPVNGTPYTIGNNQPIDGKLWAAVSLPNHSRCRGALGIRSEHIKAWLQGVMRAEDPEIAASHVRAGKMWYKFVHLCSSVWTTGTIPQQMCWVITVLIPKGGEGGSIVASACWN